MFLASFLATRGLLPLILSLLARAGLVRPNFRGDSIPVAGGIILIAVPVCFIMVAATVELFFRNAASLVWRQALLCLVLLSFGLAGFIDDAIGTREQTGFKGHLASLFRRGELTTGAFKALFGGTVGLAFAVFTAHFSKSRNVPEIVLNALIVALSANVMNMFDLRPGRAAKAYLFGVAMVFLVGRVPETLAVLLPVLGALAAFMPHDLKAHVMMGDTGSNPLGASLGVFAVFALGWPGRVVFLAVLVGLQILAEFVSLSALIERSWLLRAVDKLGRD